MTSPKHSPLPWHVRDDVEYNGAHYVALDAAGRFAAMTSKKDSSAIEYVVRAVNCHETALHALELTVALLERMETESPATTEQYCKTEEWRCLTHARAALAAMRGYEKEYTDEDAG